MTAPYGSFKSPITVDLLVGESITLSEISVNGQDVYWLEQRPSEGGRQVVVRWTPDGRVLDMTPAGYNARTTVHEYGGGSYLVWDDALYFSNFDDQRLYRLRPGGDPEPLTPQAALRYADGVLDRPRKRIICVREDHREAGREAVNTIVGLDYRQGGEGEILVSGNDFYSSPRLSSDGTRLAWLTWSHPNMPWDSTELWIGRVQEDGSIEGVERVAGGNDESVFQPEWSPDGSLYFVSDRSGWWNLYRLADGMAQPLWEMEAEFGVPQWVFGMRTYAVQSSDRLVCSYQERGAWKLAELDPHTGRRRAIATPYTGIAGVCAAEGRAVFLAASATEATAIVELDLETRGLKALRRSSDIQIDDGYISMPEAIEFTTEGGSTAHAFYYAPRNRDYQAPEGERPPLLVMAHGGPTDESSGDLDLHIQYWTSRGIAVVDVNYGGSTGFGRQYRERLKGSWGVVDVDDCVHAALHLTDRGDVDGERLAIRGGSAGGYTTLAALAFRQAFKAGASYYGIGDFLTMVGDTHKFESRYGDGLIGPYPQRRDLYVERSPIRHVEGISAPLLVLQGLEDKVVPPNQAEMIVAALRKKGTPVAYLPFEGEQHGFRRAETIKRALGAELYFYSRVFGFGLAEHVEPLLIENL